jgi:hypothetical protein
LNNDQVFDLCHIVEMATGRKLNPPFARASSEDWRAVAAVISILGKATIRLNTMLNSVDWRNTEAINAVLVQARSEAVAAGEAPEYLTISRYLGEAVRRYYIFGNSNESFSGGRLLGFRTVSERAAPDDSAYDLFISYKTIRHSAQAAQLAGRLESLGYRIWFDQNILNRMQNRPDVFEREHLISILTNAVRHSRCTVIFEATMHAVQLMPGRTEEDALADGTIMKAANDALIAWDWQGLEIAAARQGITIHPNIVTAFETENGKTKWTRNFSYGDDKQLLTSIQTGLALFTESTGGEECPG